MWLQSLVRYTIIGVGCVIFLLAVFVLLFGRLDAAFLPDLNILVGLVTTIGFVYYTTYIQSMVISALIGVLLPYVTATSYDAKIMAIVTYIIVQLGTYLLSFILFMQLYNYLSNRNVLYDVLLPVLAFILAYSIRELVIKILWHYLAHRLNAAPLDLQYESD
jgi:hypothetical protein